MIYPIYLYGSSILRKECVDVKPDHKDLPKLIDDLFETMEVANGIGLAAPQVGLSLNIFCINLTGWEDDDGTEHIHKDNLSKRVFINPDIYERTGTPEKFKEGCLSLPGINEDVLREPCIKIRYLDENMQPQDMEFDGIWARVIQHEYDHIRGKVFTDHIMPIRKNLIKTKLTKLTKGNYSANYRCKSDN